MTATESTTLRPIPEFEGVHDIWPRGKRLEAIREAARNYRERFLTQGQVRAVKSFDIAAAPYPAQYAFQNYSVPLYLSSCRGTVGRMSTSVSLVGDHDSPDGVGQVSFQAAHGGTV